VKFTHVSDNHGYLPKLIGEGLVVHSGDFLPNRSRIRLIEESFQPQWIRDNAEQLKQWLGDRTMLITPGNHDFIDPARSMQEIGLSVWNIDRALMTVEGIRFRGFSPVPYFTGEWNHEYPRRQLEDLVDSFGTEHRGDAADVIVAHSPIFGVLDRNGQGERCGSLPMRKLLQIVTPAPKYYLHGHIHESAGHVGWSRGIMVSNAATTQRIITV
jgi:Icc-related predicted phosphoesterase